MAVWQYNVTLIAPYPLKLESIKNALGLVLPEAKSWSESILTWGESGGDRIDLVLETEILEILVRFDLRVPSKQFMKDIVNLAKTHSMKIENDSGEELSADARDIAADMTRSNAFRFTTNPDRFLEGI